MLVQVPVDSLAQARFEALPRPPAELALDFRGVDRIAPVVSRSILHHRNKVGVAPALARAGFVQQGTQRMHEIQVLLLAVAADIVGLPGTAFRQYQANRFAMIQYIEPVADVLTIS